MKSLIKIEGRLTDVRTLAMSVCGVEELALAHRAHTEPAVLGARAESVPLAPGAVLTPTLPSQAPCAVGPALQGRGQLCAGVG